MAPNAKQPEEECAPEKPTEKADRQEQAAADRVAVHVLGGQDCHVTTAEKNPGSEQRGQKCSGAQELEDLRDAQAVGIEQPLATLHSQQADEPLTDRRDTELPEEEPI